MKENTLSIEIAKTPKEVFEFTINSENTHRWVEGITKEETNEYPIKLGTIYQNMNKDGVWTKYEVVDLKVNEIFELKEVGGTYSVRYTYTPLKNGGVKLTYSEQDENGISNPFKQEVLEKLKELIEKEF